MIFGLCGWMSGSVLAVGGGVSSFGCWVDGILMDEMASWAGGVWPVCCLSCEFSLASELA